MLPPGGSMVEARGRKLLRNPDNSREHSRASYLSQLLEIEQLIAILRNCSWFVRHGS
jgi:hypothetical protein